jgi:hypothetical protein
VINLKASVQQKRYTMARLYVIVVIRYMYHLNLLLLLLACYWPQLWNLEVSPAGITFSGNNLSNFLIHLCRSSSGC